MTEGSWFEVTAGPQLLQGDVLLRCPTFLVSPGLPCPVPPDIDFRLRVRLYDTVVMTQSCDLENEKVEDVLLAQLVAWPDVVAFETAGGNTAIRGRDFRRKLVEGNIPGLSLLHKHDGGPGIPWSVVEFRRLFTLPKPFLSQFAASCGPRLRLRSPYREHLAQAFARFFMRVGLPHDARDFEKEGDVKG